MTTEPNNSLPERVERLEGQLATQATGTRRRTLVIGLLGGAVIVVATLSFMRITNAGRQFDAETVTRIGRTEIERRLPGAAAAMGDNLESEAPRIVDQAIDRLAGQIPSLRSHLLRGLNEQLDGLIAKFEARLLVVMNRAIEETRKRLDEAHPNKSDPEKFRLLMSEISEPFEKNFADLSNELYPVYAKKIREVRDELEDLRSLDPGAMLRSERIRREILEIMVELANRSTKPPQ